MRRVALLALVLTAAAPAPRDELPLIEARAQATGGAVARLTARIAAGEARAKGLSINIAALDRDIAVRQAALAREQAALMPMLAALESHARRPAALLLLDPAQVNDTARAALLLDAMLPEVRARTVALRSGLAAVERQRARLATERKTLAAANSALDRDIRSLTRLGSDLAARATTLRGLLDDVVSGQAAPLRLALRLPVSGRVTTGFSPDTPGLTIAASPEATVVAPAPGRVAFAGPFRGYGPIVIVEHGGGVVSLISGLARIDVAAGAPVQPGDPLGIAAGDLYFEVRAGGRAVDPRPWVTAR